MGQTTPSSEKTLLQDRNSKVSQLNQQKKTANPLCPRFCGKTLPSKDQTNIRDLLEREGYIWPKGQKYFYEHLVNYAASSGRISKP